LVYRLGGLGSAPGLPAPELVLRDKKVSWIKKVKSPVFGGGSTNRRVVLLQAGCLAGGRRLSTSGRQAFLADHK
jgi:hypothetical protein